VGSIPTRITKYMRAWPDGEATPLHGAIWGFESLRAHQNMRHEPGGKAAQRHCAMTRFDPWMMHQIWAGLWGNGRSLQDCRQWVRFPFGPPSRCDGMAYILRRERRFCGFESHLRHQFEGLTVPCACGQMVKSLRSDRRVLWVRVPPSTPMEVSCDTRDTTTKS
jgi:hypothetical protein